MNLQRNLKIAFSILLILIIQIVFLRQMVLFQVCFCFLYLAAIIFLPYETPKVWVLTIAFGIGLLMDMFYDTSGMQGAACVFVAFIRPYILRILFPTRGSDQEIILTFRGMGTERIIRYVVAMCLFHHLLLFYIEIGTLSYFLSTFIKVIGSTVFSSVVIIFYQLVRRDV